MSVAEEEKTQNGSPLGTAWKAAAAAAATGAATYAVKKARSHDGGDSENDEDGDGGEKKESSRKKSGGQSILASAASTGWEAAADSLLPMAEDAAEAAGKYLASHGPEIVRERIVPKFIDGFNNGK